MTSTEHQDEFEPTHVVTGPLAIVATPDGQQRYLYEGGVLPEGVSDETIEHLESAGLIRPLRDGAPLPDDEWDKIRAERVEELENERAEASEDGTNLGGRPSRSASKSVWVDYAITQGMARASAEAMTRDDLAVHYTAAR